MRDTLEPAGGTPAPLQRRLEGRHVLAMLIAFFGTILAVNVYFLVRALSTHTGVVSVEPYRKGLAYNRRIAADERQSRLGWRDEIAFGPDGAVTVVLSDREGAPVSGLKVAGLLSRPSTASADVTLDLKEVGGGRYAATARAPAPGAWIVAIEVHRESAAEEPVYRARRRLWLKP